MSRLIWIALLALPLAACGSSSAPAVADPDAEDPIPAEEEAPPPVPEEAPDDGPIRVLVRPEAQSSVSAVVVDLDEPGAEVIRRLHKSPFWLVELEPGSDVEAFLTRLRQDNRVLVGERDRRISAPEGGGATLPVGGEFFPFTDIANQAALSVIGVPAAHTRATGKGMRIAVIDTGVVPTHLSLLGHIEPGGWDFVDGDPDPIEEQNGEDDDGDGFIDEGFGHGTFVSSLVLAVAPDVSILPFRVLDTDCNGLVSSVAEAITMAADAGVDAINLSLGMEHHVHTIGEAIKYARSRGALVVASAGNTGGEEVTFPATIAFAFSITSVDLGDVLADFASFGDDVDLNAPGVELLGAYPTAPDVAAKGSGTSFSTALATGAYALVRELWPAMNPIQATAHIEETSEDNTARNPGYEGKIGRGRLNLDAATMPGP